MLTQEEREEIKEIREYFNKNGRLSIQQKERLEELHDKEQFHILAIRQYAGSK